MSQCQVDSPKCYLCRKQMKHGFLQVDGAPVWTCTGCEISQTFLADREFDNFIDDSLLSPLFPYFYRPTRDS